MPPILHRTPVDADTVLLFQLTVGDGVASASDTVAITVRHIARDFNDALTIGYWKNHTEHLAEMLAAGPIDLGDTVVATTEEAQAVLRNSSAADRRNALRAHLLATVLNLRNDSDPPITGEDTRPWWTRPAPS